MKDGFENGPLGSEPATASAPPTHAASPPSSEDHPSRDSLSSIPLMPDTAAHQISRYENGHITPSTEMIVKLAECFDVSLDYLLIEGATRRPLRTGDNGFLDRLGGLEPALG